MKEYENALSSRSHAPTWFVGHSLGAAFALHLTERSKHPPAGLFLVAGFIGKLGLPKYDTINASFFDSPIDWPLVRSRIGYAECWAGDNDPYIPLERSQNVADSLQAPLTVIKNGGHLNAEAGFTKFPPVLEALTNKSNHLFAKI